MATAVLDFPRAENAVTAEPFHNLRVHLVGVGGSGMSALAGVLLRRGARVSGTDAKSSPELTRLAAAGARVSTHEDAAALPAEVDLVVASAAVPAEHAEIREAVRRGIRVVKYAQMLGALMARYDGIAISGTHGKSTTTGWLAYVLRAAGLDPNFIVGAVVDQLGGPSGVGAGVHFVAEACEFDRSFLNLRPRRAAVLNIEEDHLDCYENLEAILAAFRQFVALLPADGLLVLNGVDAAARSVAQHAGCRVETFGGMCDSWYAANVAIREGFYSADFIHHGHSLGRATLGLPGAHNLMNALAVAAVATDCGVPWDAVRAGLEAFRGAQRRLQLRGAARGVRVLDDYAHHPTEIQATLRAASQRYAPRRLWCIFQPHQHSRTRFLLDDFAASFAEAQRVVVPDIYFVRDSEREREAICAADLVERIRARGGDAAYIADFDEIAETVVREAQPGDVVITMGAGSIWKVADDLVRRLGADLPS